jgi:hypothetical protein
MITVLKNSDGFVYAYMDWYIVDGDGQQNSAGHYLFIDGIWIHEKYRGIQVMKSLWKCTGEKKELKDVTDVYWTNLKHNRQVYLKPKERFLRGNI